ncbi:hypothetical protein Drose_25705 [Dactylosporangium roseum]|uniref:Transposase IS4-like domain-containing protein n=1 Tax=Dactylosporangium roseum TaxID=47989 RepID=A0ABY5Z0N3_9ACTN|nr:hypothetical protein Drose_25705 [Dactylosporangium roseum]
MRSNGVRGPSSRASPTCGGRSVDDRKSAGISAGYGLCPSHSRWFWGLRLHLTRTPAGLPVTWALATPKLDEREALTAILDHDPHLLTDRPGLLIIQGREVQPFGRPSTPVLRYWMVPHSRAAGVCRS